MLTNRLSSMCTSHTRKTDCGKLLEPKHKLTAIVQWNETYLNGLSTHRQSLWNFMTVKPMNSLIRHSIKRIFIKLNQISRLRRFVSTRASSVPDITWHAWIPIDRHRHKFHMMYQVNFYRERKKNISITFLKWGNHLCLL